MKTNALALMEEEILFSVFQLTKSWKTEKRLKRTAGNRRFSEAKQLLIDMFLAMA